MCMAHPAVLGYAFVMLDEVKTTAHFLLLFVFPISVFLEDDHFKVTLK